MSPIHLEYLQSQVFSAGLSISIVLVSILLYVMKNRRQLLQTALKDHRRRQEEAAAQEMIVDSEDTFFFPTARWHFHIKKRKKGGKDISLLSKFN